MTNTVDPDSNTSPLSPPAFDTHVHIYPEDDAEQLLTRARQRGIQSFVVVGSNITTSEQALSLADSRQDVYATVGLHPHEADAFDGDLSPYLNLMERGNPVAVGEIGLDYYYDNSSREAQRTVFANFLQAAAQQELPAVIHCRDAYQDCLDILREHLKPGQRFEIHCFSGDPAWIAPFKELGAWFSFNGLITFKKAQNVRDALQKVPMERLLLETDTPYLAPEPYRGHPNEPAYMYEIVHRAASELAMTPEEISRVTNVNARDFLNLSDG